MQRDRTKEHLDFVELAYLESDGELEPAEARDLAAHAARCADCQAIRGQVPRLESLLSEARIEPDPDLSRRVLQSLPATAWEMRRPGSWKLAAAVFFGLFGGAYVLSLRSESLGEALPLLGTLAAMAELFRSAALAGAGLLAASWSGVGLALGEILSRSVLGYAAFGVFVLGIDCLLVRYLWRLSRVEEQAAGRGSNSSRNAG